MKRKVLYVVLAFVLIAIIGGIYYGKKVNNSKQGQKVEQIKNDKSNQSANQSAVKEGIAKPEAEVSNEIIYFYGAECPHCKDVLSFLDENNISDKVNFVKKEVWHNKENGAELKIVAEQCGLDASKVGVPLVFAKGKCYMGGPNVKNFFMKEAGL